MSDTNKNITDKIMEAGFDHPCRQTCSGWKQGYERGQYETEKLKASKELNFREQTLITIKEIENFATHKDKCEVRYGHKCGCGYEKANKLLERLEALCRM